MKRLPDKIYYSISEVADAFEVNPSLIRFWEKEFDQIDPKKNKKGDRMFTRKDIDVLEIIYHLVKEKGYTLEGARQKIKDDKKTIARYVKIRKTLSGIRSDLEKIRENL